MFFMCCETSSLVKFSLIICRKVENKTISFRTFVCLDVSVGEILNIGIYYCKNFVSEYGVCSL